MRISLPLFSQRDDLWKSKKLGTSLLTLGTSGCLVTCLAMIAKYYGKQCTPATINDDLIRVNGFALDSQTGKLDLYIWNSINKIYSDISEPKRVPTPNPVTSTQFAEIEKEITEGRPVIIEVDFIPETSSVDRHFIVIIGKEGDQWIVADPWYGDTASLSRYGEPRKTIQQYCFTFGPQPTQPVNQPSNDQAKALAALVEAFQTLPAEDELKKGNLEGYIRAIAPEHLTYAENLKKSKLFESFIEKWIVEWQLKEDPNKSHQVILEEEMGKYLEVEVSRDLFRESVKKILAIFLTLDSIDLLKKDEDYFREVDLVEEKINTLKGQLDTCNSKLKNNKVIRTFKLGKYLIKVTLDNPTK